MQNSVIIAGMNRNNVRKPIYMRGIDLLETSICRWAVLTFLKFDVRFTLCVDMGVAYCSFHVSCFQVVLKTCFVIAKREFSQKPYDEPNSVSRLRAQLLETSSYENVKEELNVACP